MIQDNTGQNGYLGPMSVLSAEDLTTTGGEEL